MRRICAGPCMAEKDEEFTWGIEKGIGGWYCRTCYNLVFIDIAAKTLPQQELVPVCDTEYVQWLETALLDMLNRPRFMVGPIHSYPNLVEYHRDIGRSVDLAERDQEIRDKLEIWKGGGVGI